MTDTSPQQYLCRALDLLADHALNRHRLDWDRVRAESAANTTGAVTTAQLYGEIQRVITDLGDPHTFFVPPDVAARAFGEDAAAGAAAPEGSLVDGRYALVRVPESAGIDAADERYVRTGIALVADLDEQDPSGWIVDLRGNTGGNMFPMLTVVAPLLGDGELGSFVDGQGAVLARWELDGGVVTVAGRVQSPLPHRRQLARPDPPIAVLTDAETMSSGEATLIAFHGKPNVRTFGAATAGMATGNEVMPLDDGALLVVTTTREADRSGRVYGSEPIPPDQPAPDALAAAVEWLHQNGEH